MTCICAQSLGGLLQALLSLEAPSLSLPLSLQQLATMQLVGPASSSLSAQVSAIASMELPSLALSAATMAQLSAVAQATAAVEAGLGIDLTAPNAAILLEATFGAINANAFAFAPFASLDPAPWMELSLLASLVMNCQAAFGVNILASGGAGALSAALSASASIAAPSVALSADAQAYASLAAVASAMGTSLTDAGGMAELSASLSAVASLSIPSLSISLGGLVSPLAILTAIANIIAGLGLNPMSPGFLEATLDLTVGLPAFAGLEIPASLALNAGTPSGSALSAIASLDFAAMAALDVSALADFQAPNLGPLSAIASFSASCAAAGFPVASMTACASSCPMSVSLG